MAINLNDHFGVTVLDPQGDKIGVLDAVYLDDATGAPDWIAVRTGMFGTKTSFVPAAGAVEVADGIAVAYAKDIIKDAPRVDADSHLQQDEEAQLYQHYGLAWGDYQYRDDVDTDATPPAAPGRGRDDAMTRSEEELRIDKVRRDAGRVRLRKYVVTEEQTVTVPVQREVARLETEPITDANRDRALDGPDITEGEHEVVLSEEQVRVDKVTVPKERVRLTTDTVTEDQQVSETIRKERIEAEGDISDKRRR